MPGISLPPLPCELSFNHRSLFSLIYGLTLDCYSEKGLSLIGAERFITHGGLFLFILFFFIVYRFFLHRRLGALFSAFILIFIVFIIPTFYFFITRWYTHNFIAFPAINRYIYNRLGPERTVSMLEYDAFASLKHNGFYLFPRYYYTYFLYHFKPLSDFNNSLLEIKYAPSTRSISQDGPLVIPHCTAYPDYCQFNLTRSKTIDISSQLGITNPLKISVERNHNLYLPNYPDDDHSLPMVITIKRCWGDSGIDLDYRNGKIINYPTGQPCK